MNERTTQIKEKVISEAKKFAVIVGCLWMLLILLQLHRLVTLREQNPAIPNAYRFGFALINALVFGKIILVAEAFHVGERFENRPRAYVILFKSAVFSVLLVCFDVLEEVVVGLFHQKTIAQSIPRLGAGGAEGVLAVGLMAFIVLIPFFSFTQVAHDIGEDEVLSLMFKSRAP